MEPVNRIQHNVLARAERRLLTWFCARLPGWVKPDHLTALGLFGGIVIFGGYAASSFHSGWLWVAIIGFFLHWFGDSLDGSLARFRKIERPNFGYFIDHSVDGLTNLMILGGLGLSPFVRLDIALFTLAGYLLLSIHAFLAARIVGDLRLSYLGGGPTELRLILITMTLLMLALGGAPVLYGLSGFDLFVGAIGILMVVLFIVQTLSTARQIARNGG